MPGDSKDTARNQIVYFPCSISVLWGIFFSFFVVLSTISLIHEPGSFWVKHVPVQSITSD